MPADERIIFLIQVPLGPVMRVRSHLAPTA
jgi:hypothetical protein